MKPYSHLGVPVLPKLLDSPYPDMPNIHIDNNDVIKLLSRLNPSEVNGPDLLPRHVLKDAATEISNYLCFIFQQSVNTGEVPPDWKQERFKVRSCQLQVRLFNVSAMQAVGTHYVLQYYDTFKFV